MVCRSIQHKPDNTRCLLTYLSVSGAGIPLHVNVLKYLERIANDLKIEKVQL